MVNQIYDLPKGSSFGLEFNYAVWTPGTTVSLCNVPWNSDYRDIVYFPSSTVLDSYLEARENPTFVFNNLTYAKADKPIRVNLPFNSVYRFNYLRAYNPTQPVPPAGLDTPRAFYYFITDVRYVSPNTTELMVQLDVWQTFSHDVTMGNCFVERGHIGIANVNGFDDNGRTYLTVPEGFDCGNEYVIDNVYEHEIASSWSTSTNPYAIIIASTVKLTPPYGDVTNPVFTTATGSVFEGIPNGCEIYYLPNVQTFQNFCSTMADKPWITQGVISVTAVPAFATEEMLNQPFVFAPDIADGTAYILNWVRPPDKSITLVSLFRSSIHLDRYALLKKFLTFPYMLIELTSYSGNPIVLKPECIPSDDLTVLQMMHLAPPAPRIAFMCQGYNMHKGYPTLNTYAGEFLDMHTGIMDLPTFSLVNNGYISFLASNKNTIAYQHSQADWSQNRALQGANTEAQKSDIGIRQTQELADVQARQSSQSAAQRANSQAWQGLAGAGAQGTEAIPGVPGSPATASIGMAQATAGMVIGVNQTMNQNAIDLAAISGGVNARIAAQRGMRDTNLTFAQYAAQGDYQNAIAGINARVQDARMIQPTTSGQIGGDAFNLAVYKWGVFARFKVVQPAIRAMIGEFWLRYGYAINRFSRMPATYQVMDTFTYWKLKETYITSSTCPEGFRQTIRGIFEKGVTVWADANDIGNVDLADNIPLPGVTL